MLRRKDTSHDWVRGVIVLREEKKFTVGRICGKGAF